VVFTLATLQQSVVTDQRMSTDGGTIDMHPRAGQIVHAEGVLIQGACKLRPSGIVAQMPQDAFQPIVTHIGPLDGLPGHRAKRHEAIGYPRFNMDEAVIASGHNGAEAQGADPARTEALPVAMRGKMVVNQRRQMHLLHLLKQEWNIVDAFCDDVLDVVHIQSLTHLRFPSKFTRTVSSTFVLVGFHFRYVSPEECIPPEGVNGCIDLGRYDHHIDEIAIFEDDDRLEVSFHDKHDDDTAFAVAVDYVWASSALLNITRSEASGSGIGGAAVTFPSHEGKDVISGFRFNYAREDHHFREIRVTLRNNTLSVSYGDKGADDNFDWNVRWVTLSPKAIQE
jgi:hypothetical protein